MYKKYELGEKISNITTGTVINIKPYGAFIKLEDGEVGLLHIEDISVSRIKSPAERLKIGQKLDVLVKSVDEETRKKDL